MKKRLNKLVEFILLLFSNFSLRVFSYLHSAKKNLLIFTDSRGYEVTKIINRKNLLSNFYIRELAKTYILKVFLAPEKFTSIIDFIYLVETKRLNLSDYSDVILHLGIVDFSPRPVSSFESYKDSKKSKLDFLKFEPEHVFYDENLRYQGESLVSFLSPNDLRNLMERFPYLKQVIWISPNRILSNWRGNYWRDRPVNINVVLEQKVVLENSDVRVIFPDFNDEEIKLFTSDNIHYTPAGFHRLYNLLMEKL